MQKGMSGDFFAWLSVPDISMESKMSIKKYTICIKKYNKSFFFLLMLTKNALHAILLINLLCKTETTRYNKKED